MGHRAGGCWCLLSAHSLWVSAVFSPMVWGSCCSPLLVQSLKRNSTTMLTYIYHSLPLIPLSIFLASYISYPFTHVSYIMRWFCHLMRFFPFISQPGGASGKEPACQCRRHKKIPWRKKRQTTPGFSLGKFQRQKSLVGLQSMGSQRVGRDWAT